MSFANERNIHTHNSQRTITTHSQHHHSLLLLAHFTSTELPFPAACSCLPHTPSCTCTRGITLPCTQPSTMSGRHQQQQAARPPGAAKAEPDSTANRCQRSTSTGASTWSWPGNGSRRVTVSERARSAVQTECLSKVPAPGPHRQHRQTPTTCPLLLADVCHWLLQR